MKRAVLLLVMLALASCNEDMVQQPRYDDFERSPLFADGSAMQAPPEGTIAQEAAAPAADTERPALTPALIARGRERFDIYCSVCHGYDGRGNGMVPARGFPQPPSYFEPRLRAASSGYFYRVITNGYGVMYSYADRVAPQDRWAISAYIGALQKTGAADAR